ncbi:hypothetical protein [Planosporangium mesophilum]|uniref:Uncharacterized protein n=1 Tax=Planosporangium mesophilum TaxID=689768 RepID=A0A8J3WZ35_9ACTN|nr:hypothetical protein [Planosporangium mesophilum]NJC81548.1 hypothetical protein [Planosporangium mesophilum]GII20794.1 hypothetical protein Pme01_03910 [Planosporangium mesophilum]
MEAADIARIKAYHRPRPWWLLRHGCTCGAKHWPCDAVLAARDAESRANQPAMEERMRMIIKRQYGR